MPAAPPRRFTFVCGPDDYLVGRAGQERFEQAAAGVDGLMREVISGFTANTGDVEEVVRRFREAVQTLGLFGGRRVVWLKDVNFLADTVTGRSEGTLALVADLQELLAAVDPHDVTVLITASPVDRRRSFLRWCETNADFVLVGEAGRGAVDWPALARAECARWGVSITPGAVDLLVGKTGGEARIVAGEIQKLATYLGEPGATIEERHVEELVPASGEGDFFEAAEAFFARDLPWTLEALRRHFFAGNDARPLLTSLQNRNRLLIQLRALMHDGEVAPPPRGVDRGALERAAQVHASAYREAAGDKTPFNVFTQHPWYLGKLMGPGAPPPLRRLIDHQFEFARGFEQLIEHPTEQEEIMRSMVIRCLASTG